MKKLTVYGWITFCPGAPGNGGQVRAICAARSMAEVARNVGERSPRALFNIGDTGNEREVALAMASLGEVLVRPINDWDAPFRVWSRNVAWKDLPEAKIDTTEESR